MSHSRQQTAAVVIIGNEVLSGKVTDLNSPFLIQRFRELGVRLKRLEIVADEAEEIGRAVRSASESHDIVITTGGVGPTHDDITMASIAAAFGVSVERHPALLRLVEAYFDTATTEAHRSLADVPEGSDLVGEERPPWPSVRYRNIYILPGIPKLMQARFDVFASRFAGPPTYHGALELRAFEAEICDRLDTVVAAMPQVEIGSYPRREDGVWYVRITVEGASPDDVEHALQSLAQSLGDRVLEVETVTPTGEPTAL